MQRISNWVFLLLRRFIASNGEKDICALYVDEKDRLWEGPSKETSRFSSYMMERVSHKETSAQCARNFGLMHLGIPSDWETLAQ